MADPVEIPLYPDVPLYTETVNLDGVDYLLRFDYSAKEDRWFLSVFSAAGAPLRLGVKVLSGWNTLRLCRITGRPPGLLFASDPRSPTADAPGFADLGRRVRLFYFPTKAAT